MSVWIELSWKLLECSLSGSFYASSSSHSSSSFLPALRNFRKLSSLLSHFDSFWFSLRTFSTESENEKVKVLLLTIIPKRSFDSIWAFSSNHFHFQVFSINFFSNLFLFLTPNQSLTLESITEASFWLYLLVTNKLQFCVNWKPVLSALEKLLSHSHSPSLLSPSILLNIFTLVQTSIRSFHSFRCSLSSHSPLICSIDTFTITLSLTLSLSPFMSSLLLWNHSRNFSLSILPIFQLVINLQFLIFNNKNILLQLCRQTWETNWFSMASRSCQT